MPNNDNRNINYETVILLLFVHVNTLDKKKKFF